jgi:hypothetical protein
MAGSESVNHCCVKWRQHGVKGERGLPVRPSGGSTGQSAPPMDHLVYLSKNTCLVSLRLRPRFTRQPVSLSEFSSTGAYVKTHDGEVMQNFLIEVNH